jgi:hypothetical protein
VDDVCWDSDGRIEGIGSRHSHSDAQYQQLP